MRSVIFDLDGTLADTAADLVAAANACFRSIGYGDLLDAQLDASTAFRGSKPMLRLGFARSGAAWSDADVEAQMQPLLDAYGAAIDVHTRLYPGAEAAIKALRSQGYLVGICTNKPQALAELLLARLGVRELFASLVGADTLAVRKPDPETLREAVRRAGGDMGRTVLVGDTTTDRETARAAGAASLLITFGPDGDGVAELDPEGLLGSYEDLSAAVARLIG